MRWVSWDQLGCHSEQQAAALLLIGAHRADLWQVLDQVGRHTCCVKLLGGLYDLVCGRVRWMVYIRDDAAPSA